MAWKAARNGMKLDDESFGPIYEGLRLVGAEAWAEPLEVEAGRDHELPGEGSVDLSPPEAGAELDPSEP